MSELCLSYVSPPEEHLFSGCWLLSCLWLSGTGPCNVFASPAGEAETPVDMETISLDPEAEVRADFCPYGLYSAGDKGRQRQVLKPDSKI